MSGNANDPRVERTREALALALHELLRAKPFAEITVQDVLDRSGIGRSTFYAHYKDKDDLLLSDADRFFGFIATRPVRELFAHVAQVRPLYDALLSSGRAEDVRSLGRAHYARVLGAPPLSEALASALFALLDYWVRTGMREPPVEMEALFARLSGILPA